MIKFCAINARCKLLARHETYQSEVERAGNAKFYTPWELHRNALVGIRIQWQFHLVKLSDEIVHRYTFKKISYDQWLFLEIVLRRNNSVAARPDAIGS